MKKFQGLFRRIVDHVENRPYPFRQYYILFFAILAIRLCLEFFSSGKLFTFDDVLHIALWFTFIVQCFVLTLHFFSGEKIEKVAKLVIAFFTLALSAPIIDLVVRYIHYLNGDVQVAKMNYLEVNSFQDIVHSYLTIGGPSMLRGATIGIRIEIILLILATFNYILNKRKSLVLGILSGISLYTILIISGIIPFLLITLNQSLHLNFQPDDRSTILLLLTLNLIFLFIAWRRHNSAVMKSILVNIPWAFVGYCILSLAMGAILAQVANPGNWSFNPTSIYSFPLLAAICICLSAAYSSQNIYGFVSGVLGLAIAAFISYSVLFTSSVFLGLIIFTFHPPLLLKQVPILRRMMEGLLVITAAFIGFCAFSSPMVGFPPHIIFSILWLGISVGLLTDLFEKTAYIIPWLQNRQSFAWKICTAFILLNLGFSWVTAFCYMSEFSGLLIAGAIIFSVKTSREFLKKPL